MPIVRASSPSLRRRRLNYRRGLAAFLSLDSQGHGILVDDSSPLRPVIPWLARGSVDVRTATPVSRMEDQDRVPLDLFADGTIVRRSCGWLYGADLGRSYVRSDGLTAMLDPDCAAVIVAKGPIYNPLATGTDTPSAVPIGGTASAIQLGKPADTAQSNAPAPAVLLPASGPAAQSNAPAAAVVSSGVLGSLKNALEAVPSWGILAGIAAVVLVGFRSHAR